MLLQGRAWAQAWCRWGCVFENWVVDAKHCTETHVFFAKPFALGLRWFSLVLKFRWSVIERLSPHQFR